MSRVILPSLILMEDTYSIDNLYTELTEALSLRNSDEDNVREKASWELNLTKEEIPDSFWELVSDTLYSYCKETEGKNEDSEEEQEAWEEYIDDLMNLMSDHNYLTFKQS